MERFWMKIHTSSGGDVVVGVCDEELLGKNLQLSGKTSTVVSRSFYGGTLLEETEVFERLRRATIINLFGNRIVERAVERGLVTRKAVLRIGGVSHVQVVTL